MIILATTAIPIQLVLQPQFIFVILFTSTIIYAVQHIIVQTTKQPLQYATAVLCLQNTVFSHINLVLFFEVRAEFTLL